MTTEFKYNPHKHVKIWLSKDPDVFMNYENQIRLISMREINPTDTITLVYDSCLLNGKAVNDLLAFCKEHNITPVDAQKFILNGEKEHKLYEYYKDEITHLKEGGNLAVASDILRWLSPVYKLGTYTDFDFPVDTSELKDTIDVQAPMLLNIGSLKIANNEFILSNNDYVAIVDPEAALQDIERIQNGIINKLTTYDTDFIKQMEKHLGKGFFNQIAFNLMKNRSETFYISKSAQFNISESRKLRNHVQKIMSSPEKFLEIKKEGEDSPEETIKKLRQELEKQLNWIRYFFFQKDYREIKAKLAESDDDLIQYVMEKERNLYLKSIVICTTGPLEISRSMFGGYVVSTDAFAQKIQPYSFNNYGLQKAFKSTNSLPMHENIIGMMHFLGEDEGLCNDSSWLESGSKLQAERIENLKNIQQQLAQTLPGLFQQKKTQIQNHIETLSYGSFFKERRAAKKAALNDVLTQCFVNEQFNTTKFQELLLDIHLHKQDVFSGLLSNRTLKLFQDLQMLSKQSVLFGLTQDRKVNLVSTEGTSTSVAP